MPQVSRIDGNTLSWVKSEIDQTMDNARKALEAYVENSQDESQLRFCLNYLHQVYGTLQMVELYGAGTLANELERLSNALISNHVNNRDEAYEVMMRGMMQLPDYLERLQHGQADYPIILLPLLNDLRAARGAPLLSESALFSPNLEVDAPIPLETAEDSIDTLVRKLRHAYHLGLLDWFRDNDVQAGLKRIGSVIERLRPAANDPDTSRILWAASGMVEALRDGGVNSSIAVKLLMGQVDRAFKKILDNGEFALSTEPPVELLKNLLYYVASSKSQGARVSELKNAFALKELMPDTETLERARADLSAPNAALMRTVSSVLLEDLTQVKDNLDVFVRSENRDPGVLSGLCNKLSQMGDTLDMLGFGAQRMLLQDQVEVLRAMGAGERPIEEPVLMDVAGSLLSIEAVLGEPGGKPAEQATAGGAANDDSSIIRQFDDPAQRNLVKSVVEEVKVDLNSIKDAFNDYSRTPKNIEVLHDVPGLLDRIRGSLSMLTLDRASQILGKASSFIQGAIIDKGERPDSHTLDLLADSISSVEYYLESLTESWGHPTAILDIAEHSLSELDIDGGAQISIAAEEDSDHSDNEQTLVDLVAPDLDMASAEPTTQESETEGELTMELSMEPTQPEINASGLQLDIPPGEDETLPANDLALEPEIDASELQIEFAPIENEIPPANDLALEPEIDASELQLDIAPIEAEISLESDFSLDGYETHEDITSSPVTNGSDTANIEAGGLEVELQVPETALSEPAQEKVTAPPAPVTQAAPADSTSSAARKPTIADELDDEIVEIFLEEADEEHGNISRLLPRWQNNTQDAEALKDLRRSFHTLKGSGRLVGAVDVGEFAWAFENLLNRVIDDSIKPNDTMFELLDQAHKTMPGLFDLFRSGQKPGQHVFKLMQQADALSKGESIDLGEAANEPEPEAQVQTTAVEEESLGIEQTADMSLELDGADTLAGLELDSLEVYSREQSIDGIEPPKDLQLTEIDVDGLHLLDQELPSQLSEPAPKPKAVTVPHIDPVLLGIYRKEIATHLKALREYVEDWRNGVERRANHKLLRALHTLKGSSRTASVPQIAELCNFLEDHVKYLQDGELNVGADLIDLFADAADFIEQTVSLLDKENATLPDNADLIVRTRALQEQTRNESPTIQVQLPETISDLQIEETVLEAPAAKENVVVEEEASAGAEEISAGFAEYDQELLEIFLEEGIEILDESDHTLSDWIAAPDNTELVKAMQRQLHTLKGGARMAGVAEIGDLSHSIENMLTAVMERDLDVSEEMFHALQKAQDRLVGMLEEIRNNRQPKPAQGLINVINALSSGEVIDNADLDESSSQISSSSLEADVVVEEISLEVPEDTEVPNETVADEPLTIEAVEQFEITPEETPEVESVSIPSMEEASTANNVVQLEPKQPPAPEPEAMPEPAEEQKQTQQRARGELIRVRSGLLDNLVNFAGEVSIYRSRMEQQTNAFRYNLTELDDTVSRLRGQLRQFEIEAEAQIQFRIEETGAASEDFDPLEFDRFTQMQTLSRGMLESLNDLNSLRSILSNLTRESETLLLQQSRVNTDLQEGLMRTRMVPIGGQVPRLRRIVRQTGEELGKKVELHIHGADNELDRTILERIMSPLEHMLRNAIAHGIEKPSMRSQSGKDETGTIQLSFAREGSDIVITVADDGAGINLDAIRKKAIERGFLKADAAVHQEDLIDFILQSGFSTAEEVTQIAGRGVGMDVVNSEIKQLGGLLDIQTERGKGTTFTISMPMSLSVTRALMIRVGDETYAIPLLGVESVERVSRDEILVMQNEKNGTYNWLEHEYRYINLSSAMGLNEDNALMEDMKKAPILLVRSGEHRAAIHVDSLIGSREIVVKPVGPQLSTLRGIAGATVMGDGSVVLILDLGVLIRLTSVEREEAFAEPEVIEQVVVEQRIPLVMVVDDSITVRKVTTRLLERNNFKTVSAKDGVDALAQLQEIKPDVMLLDVEMPRMDGFELATNIRNDKQLHDLPIIMITSRTGQKHRDRAMSIGVNIYMGKPYSEGELLDNINNLLDQKV